MATETKAKPTTKTDQEKLSLEVPERLGMNYLSMSTTDWYFVIAAQMIGATAGIATSSAAVWLGSVVLMGLLLCRVDNGRIYRIFGQWWVSRWMARPRRYLHRGTIWKAGYDSWLSRRRPPPMPFNTVTIGDDIGFFDYERADVIVIEGEGSPMITLNPQGQFRDNQRLADLIKRISAAATGYSIGISFLFRRRAPDVHAFADNLGELLHPEIAVPEALDYPEEQRTNGHNVLTIDQRRRYALHEILLEQGQIAEMYTGQTTMAMVITIQRDAKLISAFRGKDMSPREVKRLTMNRVRDMAIHGLRGLGVANPRALTSDEDLSLYVRRSWDIADIRDYYDLLQSGRFDPDGTDHWPQERILVFNDYCVVDNNLHATLKVKQGPPRVMVDFLRQLYAVDVPWLTVTQISETVSSTREYRILNRGIALKDSFDDARGVIRKSPHVQKRDAGREKREMELFQSRFGQAYVPLIGVSVPFRHELEKGTRLTEFEELEELEDLVQRVVKEGYSLGLNITRVTGQARQLPAFWSASTGIPML